ncbi:MAG TPA: methionyl-tRNA formyltransferase, partial [Planctomycetes bacterium]|nr:methionyl-tRNA formyltransferase [Planctomycetota bacterium]
MRILFLGSGPFGIPTLRRLHSMREDLIVATVPDAPSGRGQTQRSSFIKQEAVSLRLEVLETERLRGQQGQQILEHAGADLVI